MAKPTFFTSWQLWQEMSFVLAMGIVIVFVIGLIKLWVTNRQMRKLEVLDAERQARIVQMRKSGLSANGKFRFGSEIPFGVKALENGIDVDGIWVARMASMASRPPERKWSSMRKVRAPQVSLVNKNDLDGSSKKARRGSMRATKISRSEILEPSSQTRNKLESISLLEGRESGDRTGKDRSLVQAVDDGQTGTAQPGHKGTLGRIQRGLKKMTSTEMWQAGERKKYRPSEAFGAKEFHEGAQARRPQRFYPQVSTTETALLAPQARTQIAQQQVNNLVVTHGAGQMDGQQIAPMHQSGIQVTGQSLIPHRQHTYGRLLSLGSHSSSVRSFMATSKLPNELSAEPRAPSQEKAESASVIRPRDDGTSEPTQALRSSQHGVRASSSAGSGSLHHTYSTTRVAPEAPGPGGRYPPNSSRSGGNGPPRSRSLTRQQQHQQISPTPSSPASSPGEEYVSTLKQKTSTGVGFTADGALALSNGEQYGATNTSRRTSAAGSVRSSFDSQRSSGRKKLQKSRTHSGNDLQPTDIPNSSGGEQYSTTRATSKPPSATASMHSFDSQHSGRKKLQKR